MSSALRWPRGNPAPPLLTTSADITPPGELSIPGFVGKSSPVPAVDQMGRRTGMTRASTTKHADLTNSSAFLPDVPLETPASDMDLSPPLLSGELDACSDAESLHGAQLPYPPPMLREENLLARFKNMLQGELSAATSKLATHKRDPGTGQPHKCVGGEYGCCSKCIRPP